MVFYLVSSSVVRRRVVCSQSYYSCRFLWNPPYTFTLNSRGSAEGNRGSHQLQPIRRHLCFPLTSFRAERGRSSRRPSTTSSRPSAAAPVTPGRLVNLAVSVRVFKAPQNLSIQNNIDPLWCVVLCCALFCLELLLLLLLQHLLVGWGIRFAPPTKGRRTSWAGVRHSYCGQDESLLDARGHPEAQLEKPLIRPEKLILWGSSGGELPGRWILWRRRQGSASSRLRSSFIFFLNKAHDVHQKNINIMTCCRKRGEEVTLTFHWGRINVQARRLSGTGVQGEPSVCRWWSEVDKYLPIKLTLRHSEKVRQRLKKKKNHGWIFFLSTFSVQWGQWCHG